MHFISRPQVADITRSVLRLSVVAALTVFVADRAAAQGERDLALQACESLQGLTVSSTSIGLPTRGATVVDAERIESKPRTVADNGESILPLPAYCRRAGEIASSDDEAPERPHEEVVGGLPVVRPRADPGRAS